MHPQHDGRGCSSSSSAAPHITRPLLPQLLLPLLLFSGATTTPLS